MNKKHLSLLAVILALAGVLYLSQSSTVAASSPHVPGIVAHQSLVGQTADITPILISVPSGGADYRITINEVTTVGNTQGTVLIDYTGDLGAIEPAFSMGTESTVAHPAAVIHAVSGTLAISNVDTQTGGAQTYNLYVTVEEL